MSKSQLWAVQPFVLGHASNGRVKAIKGSIRKQWNGEWTFSEVSEDITISTPLTIPTPSTEITSESTTIGKHFFRIVLYISDGD